MFFALCGLRGLFIASLRCLSFRAPLRRDRKNTQFRRDAALSLAALLEAFPECCVYEMLAPTLLDLAVLRGSPTEAKNDPIMQARAVSCLAAAWPRMPPMSPSARTESGGGNRHETETKATSSAVDHREVIYDVQREHAASLTRALCGSIRQKVWSVRVPILDALSAMVSRTYVSPKEDVATSGSAREHAGRVTESPLPSILTSALLADVVQAVETAAEDAKYSQVSWQAGRYGWMHPVRDRWTVLHPVLSFVLCSSTEYCWCRDSTTADLLLAFDRLQIPVPSQSRR